MEENKKNNLYKVIMLVVLVAFITFLITSIGVYQYLSGSSYIATKSLLGGISGNSIEQELNKYKSIIDKYYLGEVDENKLKEGAIKGYIEALEDPYTEYISKEEMNDYLEDTMGNFVGIGIYMVKDTESNKIAVLSPIKNSPAEKSGILPGDYILSVDGISYTGEEMSVASSKIKGEEGTNVKLEILRDDKTLTFEIKREKITVNPVESEMLDNNIGYIEFTSFDENTSKDFKTKLEELKNKGMKSLIIDLRNNGGGIVDEALEIADYFTPKDAVLLYEVDKNGKEEIEKSKSDPIVDIPVIILTNKNTASSSEILAGALKDLGKARTVGEKTYGKGVIQEIISLKDGSGMKITSEKYLTPNRKEINKVGIEPDIKVELPEDITNILNIPREKDTQLQKAIELFK